MWSLLGAAVYPGAIANAADLLDIGLVYPRANETYEPTDEFPLVFALQNVKQAEYLEPTISLRVLNLSKSTSDIEVLSDRMHELRWGSVSENEPYLFWSHFKVSGEGQVRVIWQAFWSACEEISSYNKRVRNRTDNFLVDIEVKNGGQKADLVAGTAGDSNDCPNQGVAINVTTDAREYSGWTNGRQESGTCAVLASPSPTSTSNTCRVKIESSVVESMEAVDLAKRCRGLNSPAECPEKDEAVTKLAAMSVPILAALLGTALFLA
ncbi:hypothetical protein D7B24_003078 [Verticillium nonalfalfae]|uniref:DUF7136 domain-containing protein n=1 Tax=Verticillium nonalfalfae TaxID=1051616 RepID=A0A3M9XWS1_9PEZI|nr:uncharacterized protein D7B24_003078 [Verticillium nonalfalfae]RNJ52709.1 hypothetical protein D7B24_003078 [Verticillium nonalfalfae]